MAKSEGFSLVELMIVVGIVGILAAIAVPNFTEFALRARHSEAKANLSTLYAAEVIFRSEYGSYSSVFDSIGFQPTGALNYGLGFDWDQPPPPEAPVGTATCRQTCPQSRCPASFVRWLCIPSSSTGLDGTLAATITPAAFRAVAHAHFAPDPSGWYTFYIDQTKQIRQQIPAN